MKLLHRIGERVNSNFNTIDEILKCKGPLSFDGVYTEVWDYREKLKERSDVVLFFCGQHVGGDNSFDVGQPDGKFCSWKQLFDLKEFYGFRLGYHSLRHRNLTELSDDEVRQEVLKPFPWLESFAYPYGNVDARVAKLVEEAGYSEAWSVNQGDGTQFQKNRTYLNW